MSRSSRKPAPGSRSETASAMRDQAVGAAVKGVAATALTIRGFMNNAAASGIYEIEAAEIALRRSRNEDVKKFARRMIADHKDLDTKLKSFIGGLNKPLEPPEELDMVHRILIDDLNGASDEDFDKRYVSQQKSAHSNAITLFTSYRDHGEHEGLRNLCGLALPVLEEHMEMVRGLAGRG